MANGVNEMNRPANAARTNKILAARRILTAILIQQCGETSKEAGKLKLELRTGASEVLRGAVVIGPISFAPKLSRELRAA